MGESGCFIIQVTISVTSETVTSEVSRLINMDIHGFKLWMILGLIILAFGIVSKYLKFIYTARDYQVIQR